MAERCRLCTTNDREALVAELAEKMWDYARRGTMDDHPLVPGSYWSITFGQYARAYIDMMKPLDG